MVIDLFTSPPTRVNARRVDDLELRNAGIALADLEFGLRGQFGEGTRCQIRHRPGMVGKFGDRGDPEQK
jgi:hypothetical protein